MRQNYFEFLEARDAFAKFAKSSGGDTLRKWQNIVEPALDDFIREDVQLAFSLLGSYGPLEEQYCNHVPDFNVAYGVPSADGPIDMIHVTCGCGWVCHVYGRDGAAYVDARIRHRLHAHCHQCGGGEAGIFCSPSCAGFVPVELGGRVERE